MYQQISVSNLPPLESLPKIVPSELSDELKKLHVETRTRSAGAITKMVGFVCVTTGMPANEVGVQDILHQEVVNAMIEYSKVYESLRYKVRVVYRALGTPQLVPLLNQVYTQYHPVLLEWLKVFEVDKHQVSTRRATCMGFLKWFCQNTLINYEPHSVPLAYIQRHHLMEYRRHLLNSAEKKQKLYTSSRAQLKFVIQWFKWLIEEQRIGSINLTGITIKDAPNRERRIPGQLQISKFLETLMSTPASDKETYVLFFLLLLATGARFSEILRLTTGGINHQNHTLRLQSKNGPVRWVPIGINLWTLLMHHITLPKNKMSKFVLHGPTGEQLHMRCVYKRYLKVKLQAGVDIDGTMAFRHRFATDCYEAKTPVNVFQYLMGHTTTREMKRYQHRNEYLEKQEVDQAIIEWLGDLQ